MSATAGPTEGQRSLSERLGLESGQVVQEIGYDDDCDEDLRQSIVERTGNQLVGEDHEDVVDSVLLWWREEDGDLAEALMDAPTSLADGGQVWLLTPKVGREGHVEPSDIGESAPTAGLTQTSNINAARDWTATRLVTPKSRR